MRVVLIPSKACANRLFITPTPPIKDIAPQFLSVNNQNGLLEDQEAQFPKESAGKTQSSPDQMQKSRVMDEQNLTLPIKLVEQLITKEITKTAAVLELDLDELQAWINLQVMTPSYTLLALLRITRQQHLDPP